MYSFLIPSLLEVPNSFLLSASCIPDSSSPRREKCCPIKLSRHHCRYSSVTMNSTHLPPLPPICPTFLIDICINVITTLERVHTDCQVFKFLSLFYCLSVKKDFIYLNHTGSSEAGIRMVAIRDLKSKFYFQKFTSLEGDVQALKKVNFTSSPILKTSLLQSLLFQLIQRKTPVIHYPNLCFMSSLKLFLCWSL